MWRDGGEMDGGEMDTHHLVIVLLSFPLEGEMDTHHLRDLRDGQRWTPTILQFFFAHFHGSPLVNLKGGESWGCHEVPMSKKERKGCITAIADASGEHFYADMMPLPEGIFPIESSG